jgi:hypothetical protein
LPLWRNGDAASAKSLITVSRVVHAIIHIEMSGPRTISAMRLLLIDAGPTGLVLALWLSKLGVKVRIVDKTAEPGTTSRALAVQARTLGLYRQLDLAETKLGHKAPAASMWVKGKLAAR